MRSLKIKIIVATSGPYRHLEFVKNWLSHNKIEYDDFCSVGPRGSKVSLDADALVDDAPEIVRAFISKKRTGFLYSQPWNIRTNIANAIVVRSLREVGPDSGDLVTSA
jgi:hypothetical protein